MLNTHPLTQILVNASKNQALIIPAGATVEAGAAKAGLELALKALPARAAVIQDPLQLLQTITFTAVVTGAILAVVN